MISTVTWERAKVEQRRKDTDFGSEMKIEFQNEKEKDLNNFFMGKPPGYKTYPSQK